MRVAAVLGVIAVLGTASILRVAWERSLSSPTMAISGVTGVPSSTAELLAWAVSGKQGAAELMKKLLSTLVLGAGEVVSPAKTLGSKYLAKGPLGSDMSEIDAEAASGEVVRGYQSICLNP